MISYRLLLAFAKKTFELPIGTLLAHIATLAEYYFFLQISGLSEQGIPILPFPCILPCFAGHFLYSFAVFAGEACKNSKTILFVSAVGAKSAENGNALTI